MGVYGFRSQLRNGQVGEIIWYEANCKDVVRLEGYNGDFAYKDTGATLELKTDYWDMAATPNFFFERFSDKARATPGGPWQAQSNGCTYFVYFYVHNLIYYVFRTAALVERLEGIIPTLKPTHIANKNHVTMGYRVPRDLLKDLAQEYTITLATKKEKTG